jgi:hypothetical protein
VDIEKSPYPLAHLNLFLAYNFQVYFGLPTNPINIHKQKLPGKKINESYFQKKKLMFLASICLFGENDSLRFT